MVFIGVFYILVVDNVVNKYRPLQLFRTKWNLRTVVPLGLYVLIVSTAITLSIGRTLCKRKWKELQKLSAHLRLTSHFVINLCSPWVTITCNKNKLSLVLTFVRPHQNRYMKKYISPFLSTLRSLKCRMVAPFPLVSS